MATTWKINGTDIASFGVKNLKLTFENMQPDTCTFDDPTAAFDANPLFAFDAAITVTRNTGSGDVKIFVGKIAETPHFLGAKAERISYTALGPWQDLKRHAFLQTFAIPVDPTNPSSALSSFPSGIVVFNQDDTGAACLLSAALAYVIDSAIAAGAAITRGAITGLGFYVPWDEDADVSCADALVRLLHLTPDVVCWWDYTTTTPTLHICRRASLSSVDVEVASPGAGGRGSIYAPLETVEITPLNHLKASGVCVIYVRTDRTDGKPWLLTARDVYPGGTVPAQLDCLTRTIKLTGAVTTNTYLTQDVETASIPATALSTDPVVTFASDPSTFGILSDWWIRHCPHLLAAGITIKGFRYGYRAPVANDLATPDASCTEELLNGTITPWMEDDLDIVEELQNVRIEVAYDIVTDVNTGATEHKVEKLAVQIRATNASTQTYSELSNTSYTPPETAPAGLAQAIYNGVSQLHYDGTFDLVAAEAPLTVLPGNTVNLTNSRTEWATMIAVVQRVTLAVDHGRTTVKIGWPHQLMPADLMQIYRANRLRRDVTSDGSRATGVSGDSSGNTAQGLGKKHPGGSGPAGHVLPSVFMAQVTLASPPTLLVNDLQLALHDTSNPTGGEIYNATSTASAKRRPKSGDQIRFYLKADQCTGTVDTFKVGIVTQIDPRPDGTDTVWNFSFAANGDTWYMHCAKAGPYQPVSS